MHSQKPRQKTVARRAYGDHTQTHDSMNARIDEWFDGWVGGVDLVKQNGRCRMRAHTTTTTTTTTTTPTTTTPTGHVNAAVTFGLINEPPPRRND